MQHNFRSFEPVGFTVGGVRFTVNRVNLSHGDK